MPIWPSIIAHSAEVVGIHPKFSRLLVVRVRLDRTPPPRWRELFEESIAHIDAEDPCAIQLEEASILLRAQDDALDEAITDAILRIQQANQRHEAELLGLRDGAIQPADLDQQQRLEGARKRAEVLNRLLDASGTRILGAWAMPAKWVPASEQGVH